MKKILSIITARGGSQRIPRKNVKNFCGKPLMVWSIEASLKSKYINRTIVSSEDSEILSIAEKYGAEKIKRPKRLSGNKIASEQVLLHVLDYLKKKEEYVPDFFVLLQPTSPLRDSHDIDSALNILFKNNADSLISVYKLKHNPLKSFFINKTGFLKSISNSSYPFMRAQDLPDVFMPNGAMYVIKTKIFLRHQRLLTKKTIPFIMEKEKSVDIDTFADFKKAEEYFLKNQNKRQ